MPEMIDDTPMSHLKSDVDRAKEMLRERDWDRRASRWLWNQLHPHVLARMVEEASAARQDEIDGLMTRIEALEGDLDKVREFALRKMVRVKTLRLRVRELEGDAPAIRQLTDAVEDMVGRAPDDESTRPRDWFAATLARREAEALREEEIATRIVELSEPDPGWNERERLGEYERTATHLAGSRDLGDVDRHIGARWLRMEPKRRSAALEDLREGVTA